MGVHYFDRISTCHKHNLTNNTGEPCYMCEREKRGRKKSTEIRPRKPKDLFLYDGTAQYYPEEYDDMGGGARGLQIDAFIYDSKNALKLAKWLVKASEYLKHKERLLK